ncbi:uncharacterized protein PHACADRAFT_247628 [Phanerochaete carnosa HHB-10118-sp]|uniref:Uncharacterized protein n=1 Tax=Phanerochaete carnosa (strain HHB-10118-sp) TaxID=650164 RepID=K5XDS0_PHACS|nr:uncharacterized protein PHACADRAFT_247628 [Phanerochaete carnosa HHB-10118-sp]EKM61182.1 hypothetical protein PHACADRAFT_247628 [Phanerochaete carnosa HHB-10118-sp]
MSILHSPTHEQYNAEAGPSSYPQRQHLQVCSSRRDVALTTHPLYANHSEHSPPPHSATSSQSSLRSARPLPPIPVPSPPATPLTPSERASFHPRPLPTPPLRTRPSWSSTSSVSTPRPLPQPVPLKIDTTHLRPQHAQRPPRPALSLLINTLGMSPTEITLESPVPLSPMSPVIFSKPDTPSPTDMEKSVAMRLNMLGFREVDEDTFARLSLKEGSKSPPSSPSSTAVSSSQTSEECQEKIEIRLELRSTRSDSRGSRLWVCEKRGKRWVERNYGEILQQLRKL